MTPLFILNWCFNWIYPQKKFMYINTLPIKDYFCTRLNKIWPCRRSKNNIVCQKCTLLASLFSLSVAKILEHLNKPWISLSPNFANTIYKKKYQHTVWNKEFTLIGKVAHFMLPVTKFSISCKKSFLLGPN